MKLIKTLPALSAVVVLTACGGATTSGAVSDLIDHQARAARISALDISSTAAISALRQPAVFDGSVHMSFPTQTGQRVVNGVTEDVFFGAAITGKATITVDIATSSLSGELTDFVHTTADAEGEEYTGSFTLENGTVSVANSTLQTTLAGRIRNPAGEISAVHGILNGSFRGDTAEGIVAFGTLTGGIFNGDPLLANGSIGIAVER